MGNSKRAKKSASTTKGFGSFSKGARGGEKAVVGVAKEEAKKKKSKSRRLLLLLVIPLPPYPERNLGC